MRSKHADTAHSVSILSVTNREAQKTIKADISSNNCTGWAKKTGLCSRSDNFATTNDRKARNTSKVSEFCLE